MKHRHLVAWAWGIGAISALVACAPEVTVSKDDSPGGEGGSDVVTTVGGSSSAAGHGGSLAGHGGSGPAHGGSGAVAAGSGGSGGDVGERAGTGGTDPVGSAGDDGIGNGGTAPEPPAECPCSRRPTAPPSMYCPHGINSSVSLPVGPEGATIEVTDTPSTDAAGVPFRVIIAPGTFASSVDITASEKSLPPPDGFFDVSPVYRIEPDGLAFPNGAAITVPWTVPSGDVPQAIAIYYAESPGGPWERMADSYMNAGFEQATLTRSGYFMAAYPKTEELADCP